MRRSKQMKAIVPKSRRGNASSCTHHRRRVGKLTVITDPPKAVLHTPTQLCYEQLMKDVARAYRAKFDAALKRNNPRDSYDWVRGLSGCYTSKFCYKKDANGPVGVNRMWQRNMKTRTFREVRWFPHQRASSGLAGFHYDANDDPNGEPRFVPVTDVSMKRCLSSLGSFRTCSETQSVLFSPEVPLMTPMVTIGHNTYQVSVVFEPVPPGGLGQPPFWQHDVLFGIQDHFTFDTAYMRGMLQQMLNSKDDADRVSASSHLANLATLFSSVSQGFIYSSEKSRLWIKPQLFKFWLSVAIGRGYTRARVLMHGMRAAKYNEIANDPAGYDMEFSQGGLQGFGMYASLSDHLASFYNEMNANAPVGTVVIGLHLVSPTAFGTSYVDFHLRQAMHIFGCTDNSNHLNATCVRDTATWLPLGVVYPE